MFDVVFKVFILARAAYVLVEIKSEINPRTQDGAQRAVVSPDEYGAYEYEPPRPDASRTQRGGTAVTIDETIDTAAIMKHLEPTENSSRWRPSWM